MKTTNLYKKGIHFLEHLVWVYQTFGIRGYIEYNFLIPFLYKHVWNLTFRKKLLEYTNRRFPMVLCNDDWVFIRVDESYVVYQNDGFGGYLPHSIQPVDKDLEVYNDELPF